MFDFNIFLIFFRDIDDIDFFESIVFFFSFLVREISKFKNVWIFFVFVVVFNDSVINIFDEFFRNIILGLFNL